MEKVCRALALLSAERFEERRGTGPRAHLLSVLAYQQRRDAAARRSKKERPVVVRARKKPPPSTATTSSRKTADREIQVAL